jgi:ribose transport system permease protein
MTVYTATAQPEAPARARSRLDLARGWPGFGSAALFVGMLVFCTILRPGFLAPPSASGFLATYAPPVCLAIAASVVMLIGSIDLSIGPLMGLANILTVLFGSVGFRLFSAGPNGAASACSAPGSCGPGLPFVAGALLAVLACAVFGCLNGVLVAYLRLQPLLATLASGFVATGLSLWLFPSPGGSVSAHAVSVFGSPSIISVPLISIVVVTVLAVVLVRSPLGVRMRAVGSDRQRAYFAGINVAGVTVAAFTAVGVLAGLAGVLFTLNVSSADPTLGVTFTLNAIAGAVLGGAALRGGRAEPIGPVFGALVLGLVGVLIDALNVATYYQELASGLVILAALTVTARATQRRKV